MILFNILKEKISAKIILKILLKLNKKKNKLQKISEGEKINKKEIYLKNVVR